MKLMSNPCSSVKMKQLDVDISPPASIINLVLGRVHGVAFACKLYNFGQITDGQMALTHATYDLDPSDL